MRHTLIALLLSACCGSAFALVEANPPAPDSQTFVKLIAHTGYCAAQSAVAVQGFTITLTVTPPSAGVLCPASFAPITANVGVLPPGVYDVSVRLAGGSEIEHSKMIVRDAGSGIIVSPVGSRTDGRDVQVFGADLSTSTAVFFDGVPATNVRVSNNSLVVLPPPHAAGTVDVTVNDSNGSRKSVAAFTYYDPSAPPDPFVFEPVLYPVAYDGPGIFDSQWTTNNVMGTARTVVRFRDSIPARFCNGDCSALNWSAVLSPESQSGLLVWAVRRRLPVGVQDDFHVSSRIFDTSRVHGSGTSLPVAREGDFKSHFQIDDVPFSTAARVTLRLYSPDAVDRTVDVTSNANGVSTRQVTLHAVNGVGYATVDLGPTQNFGLATSSVTVKPSGAAGDAAVRLWGLVTVTDNTTQDVTAFWPQ
jgi:hypothetical protein